MTKKIPTCKNCNNLCVSADAGIFKSIPYFYCRNCKVEVNDWGFEIEAVPKPVDSLKDLEDYLSGEIGRFDNEAPSSSKVSAKKPLKLNKNKSVYDPFHKRNIRVDEEDDDHLFGDGLLDFEII
jgi:hypothetical protein